MVKIIAKCLHPGNCVLPGDEWHIEYIDTDARNTENILKDALYQGIREMTITTLEGGHLGQIRPDGDIWWINPN